MADMIAVYLRLEMCESFYIQLSGYISYKFQACVRLQSAKSCNICLGH